MRKVVNVMLIGVAIIILVAPGRGSETWEKFAKGVKDWKDDAMAKINNLVSHGKSLAARRKNMVETAKTEARQTVDQW